MIVAVPQQPEYTQILRHASRMNTHLEDGLRSHTYRGGINAAACRYR
jgi:hypothetical protein